MQITTVDPGDQVAKDRRPVNQSNEYLPLDQIGRLVEGRQNVRIIKSEFDRINWMGNVFDFIYIDGNHTYESVLTDSHLALELLNKDGGLIIWHDFNNVPAVKTALDTLITREPIVSIHNTWIAYLDTHK